MPSFCLWSNGLCLNAPALLLICHQRGECNCDYPFNTVMATIYANLIPKSVRITLLPIPRIPAHIFQAAFRFPAQLTFGVRCIGVV